MKTQDISEHEAKSVDVKTWFEMCVNGQVTDGKTLSTTLLAQPHLSQFMRSFCGVTDLKSECLGDPPLFE